MKKWIGYILSLYILFCALVPCTFIEGCEDEHMEQTSQHDSQKNCTSCSPFSICCAATVFTPTTAIAELKPVEFCISPSYSDYYFSSKSEYYPVLFQPPRIG